MSPGFPESLFDALAARVGADVSFVTDSSGPTSADDPFRAGDAELGWICSTSYVDLGLQTDAPSIRIAGVAWVPDDPEAAGRPVYFGDVVVPADSPIESFDDLAGQTIGCNDQVSLSGHYALRFECERRGFDPESFAQREFTGGHHTSLDRLVAGDLDAAVVDSVVRTTRARRDPAVAGLRIIERLGPWPTQPLVVRSDIDDATLADLQQRLLAANDDPDVQAELRAAGLDRLVSVDHNHYAAVHAAMSKAD